MRFYRLTFHDFVMDINEIKAFPSEKDAIGTLMALKELHLSIHQDKADYSGKVSCVTVREDAKLLVSIINAINDCDDYVVSREDIRVISS